MLLFAPISRTYSKPYDVDTSGVTLAPYRHNALTYQYCFMWDHYLDPLYYETARVIHGDVKRLKLVGLNGMVSGQTQRAYFPTGFGMYVLAQTLWDDEGAFDDLAEAYFGASFGSEAGERVRAYKESTYQMNGMSRQRTF